MSDTAAFEAQRPRLKRLAYRMLGSVSEAEDVVQDAWLRWDRAGEGALDAGAWLAQTTTRLCLDRLKSARARRETYVGPWLPEPLIEEEPVDPLERAEDVSVAFLLALERLSPLERPSSCCTTFSSRTMARWRAHWAAMRPPVASWPAAPGAI